MRIATHRRLSPTAVAIALGLFVVVYVAFDSFESPSLPEIEHCVSQQIAECVEASTENHLLVAEAVNVYLRKAQLTPEEAEPICRHPNDSERIYLAYMVPGLSRFDLLVDDAAIHVAGTMVQMKDCWFLLMDGGGYPLQDEIYFLPNARDSLN